MNRAVCRRRFPRHGGDEPVAALQHFQGDAEEAFFVDVHRLAPADAGTDQQHGEGDQRQAFGPGVVNLGKGYSFCS
jgi:hypothetical protein